MSKRSAHASIKGYFAQLVRAALEWTRIGPGERLVIEGDEDYDRQIFNGGQLITTILNQHKAVAAAIGWSKEVQRSVLGFVAAFARYDLAGVSCTPMFTSTSEMAPTVDVIREWAGWELLTDDSKQMLADRIAGDLRMHELLTGDSEFALAAKSGVAYLDADPARWVAFVGSTLWEFGAATDDENLSLLADALALRGDAKSLPGRILAVRVLVAVIEAGRNDTEATRTLTASELSIVIATVRAELVTWADSPQAALFLELLDLARLAEESRQKIEVEFRRGTVDQRGGLRIPRPQLSAQLAQNGATAVVVGERGTGKTSIVADWARAEMQAARPVIWVTCRATHEEVDRFLRDHVGCRLGAALFPVLAKRKIALVVDAIDQGRSPEARSMLVELVERATEAKVRTVALVRDGDARTDPNVQRLLALAARINVAEFNDVEHGLLLAGVNAPAALSSVCAALPGQVSRLVRLPLHAHFVWQVAARLPPNGSVVAIASLVDLMDQYWTRVVSNDGEGIPADGPLRELILRMLGKGRLSAPLAGIENEGVLRRLVRAEVLRHQHVPSFGIDDGEASFAYDAVFDYAVFRLLWRNASNTEIVRSLASCGTLAAGLDQSFRRLLEFVEAARGVDAAVGVVRDVYSAIGIEEGSRERLAMEFVSWMVEQHGRRQALVKQIREPGGRLLFERVTVTRLGG